MTIADNYEPIKQETNGVTTQFSFDFYALNDAYIKVYLEVDGEQSVIDPSDYEVTFDNNGGIVAFYDPPAANAYIIITRATPKDQETPFATSSGFPAKTVEGRFDKLTAMAQESQDDINRSVKFPVGNNLSVELPLPEAGKALMWNDDENAIVNSDESLEEISEKATGAATYAGQAKEYRDQASGYAGNASDSATLAQNWAIKTDGPVADSEYSAKKHAQDAAISAEQAAQSAAISNPPPLLTHLWSDHLLNDIRYLRADTFSWHNGSVYKAAYNHLFNDVGYVRYMIPDDDIQEKFYRSPSDDTTMFAWTNQYSTLYTVSEYPQNGDDFYYHNQVFGTVLSTGEELGSDAVTPTTETIGSYTITYYPCADGHKIVLADQESTVLNIYNESGVAWYYILDTINQRFKLPRELPISDKSKGNGITLGWTDGTNNYGSIVASGSGVSGRTTAYGEAVGGSGGTENLATKIVGITTDPTKSGIISHRANENGQQYLYFYVGNFTQTATEQTAGLNAELFNGKVDLNAANLSDAGKSLISGLGMPSNTYESITAGANDSTYESPANGWFTIFLSGSGNCGLQNDTAGVYSGSDTAAAQWHGSCLPVKKGDIVSIHYNVYPTWFRFVYAKGSESEA